MFVLSFVLLLDFMIYNVGNIKRVVGEIISYHKKD
jgi:hypothetical protein